ncbi:MAG: hypothetical protein ACRDDJ_19905 [[Mycobacterium] stephanolepidis]
MTSSSPEADTGQQVNDDAWLASILGEEDAHQDTSVEPQSSDDVEGAEVAVPEDDSQDLSDAAAETDAGPVVDQDPFGKDEPAAAEKVPTADPVQAKAAVDDQQEDQPDRRFNPAVVGGAVALVVIATVAALVIALVVFGGSSDPTPPRIAPVKTVAAALPPPAEPVTNDQALPFTVENPCPPGSVGGCKPPCASGSSTSQALDGSDANTAFVCVRNGADGQTFELNLGHTYTSTAVCITPGWVGADGSGVDQWNQHRVVSKLQYVLINGQERTVVQQDTGNVAAETCIPVKGPSDRGALAARVRVTILQTSRPPVQKTDDPGPAGAGGGGLLDALTGPAPADGGQGSAPPVFGGSGPQQGTDPVDTTFAIKQIKILGHESI